MTFVRKRLTYANVMSSIAVFLVLGGATAFAAGQLGKNTVGSKQLKKNAVTSAKIKNGAVTASKIAGGAVGASQINTTGLTVPNATKAALATKAESATKAETATKANSATNAEQLGGVPAATVLGRAGRVAFQAATSDSPISTVTDPFAEATIVAPARGFLVAQTSLIDFSGTPASCPCVIQTQLKIDGGSGIIVSNTNLGTAAAAYVGGFDRQPVSGAEVFPVEAGAHTVVAQSVVQTSSALTGLGTSDETLQVVFVPLNGSGVAP